MIQTDPAVVKFLQRVDTGIGKLEGGRREIAQICQTLRGEPLSDVMVKLTTDELKTAVSFYVQTLKDTERELSVATTEFTLVQMSERRPNNGVE